MKEDLANNVSKFQIGSIPEHACEEHVLTIKTILANKELINEGLIFFSADIKSFFDKEDVLDVVNSLKELKINDKAIRMWYKLNENTKIKVKTAVGITDEANIGPCVAQGTISASIVSAANLDRGLFNKFNNVNVKSASYFGIKILPLAY